MLYVIVPVGLVVVPCTTNSSPEPNTESPASTVMVSTPTSWLGGGETVIVAVWVPSVPVVSDSLEML